MKILVDENIPRMTVRALREQGHDVVDVRGTLEEGLTDDLLWQRAAAEGRMVITTDKGFARRRDQPHDGVLIVRLARPNRRKIHERVLSALQQVAEPDWPGLLVIMRDQVRSDWRAPSA